MKLFLDAHYPPVVAAALRQRGYDIVAAVELQALRQLSDEGLLRFAQREHRVMVTEDVRDFTSLHLAWMSRGEAHMGMLFASSRKYSRKIDAVGQLIEALAAFMDDRGDAEVLVGEVAWL